MMLMAPSVIVRHISPLLVSKTNSLNKNAFPCGLCSKSFEKRSRLASHMLSHTNDKNHICEVCNKGFKNRSQLIRHKYSHNDEPQFSCKYCGKRFKHNDVAKHVRRMHSGPRRTRGLPGSRAVGNQVPSQVIQESPNQTESSVPPEIQVSQSNSETLESLEVTGNRETEAARSLELNLQHQSSEQHDQASNAQIGDHIEAVATTSRTETVIRFFNPVERFPCTECSMSFAGQGRLLSHMVAHHTPTQEQSEPVIQSLECHVCLKTFSRSSVLTIHLKLHSPQPKPRSTSEIRCHLCSKKFTRRSSFNAHLLEHKGVLRFWCDKPNCGKGFVHPFQVIRHQRLHSNRLPYSCKICGKNLRNSDLSKHMRLHKGVKSYRCQHCGKAFFCSSSRRKHERKHLVARNRKYKCQICRLGYLKSSTLQRHLKTHALSKDQGQTPSNLPTQESSHFISQSQLVQNEGHQLVQQQMNFQMPQIQIQPQFQHQMQHHMHGFQVQPVQIQVQPVQVQVQPIQVQPVHCQPIQVQQIPVQQIAFQQIPTQQVSIQQFPFQQISAQQFPVQQIPFHQISDQQIPFQQIPFQQIPFQQIPFQQIPFQQTPFQQIPFQQIPFQPNTFQPIPFQQIPFQQIPLQQFPVQQIPFHQIQETLLQAPVQQVQQLPQADFLPALPQLPHPVAHPVSNPDPLPSSTNGESGPTFTTLTVPDLEQYHPPILPGLYDVSVPLPTARNEVSGPTFTTLTAPDPEQYQPLMQPCLYDTSVPLPTARNEESGPTFTTLTAPDPEQYQPRNLDTSPVLVPLPLTAPYSVPVISSVPVSVPTSAPFCVN